MKHILIFILLNNFFVFNFTATKVPVYHRIGKNGTVESIKKHGLLNWHTLFEKGLIDFAADIWLFPDHDKVIYFDPHPSMKIYSDIAYLVDPSTTYVYNREHRYYRNLGYYQGSQILLKDYLESLEKAEQLKKSLMQDDGLVVLDHITSKPEVLTPEDLSRLIKIQEHNTSYKTKLTGYLPEVIIATQCIPPEQLIFLNNKRKSVEL